MRAFWKDVNGTIRVATPSPEMDIMLNNWLLYQSLSCRMWARTAFYQAGGAFGFRDQLQDSLAMLHIRPGSDAGANSATPRINMTKATCSIGGMKKRIAASAPASRTICSGCRMPSPVIWSIPGTRACWTKSRRSCESEPLKDGEHERYEETVQSHESGTMLEHCFRALERALAIRRARSAAHGHRRLE